MQITTKVSDLSYGVYHYCDEQPSTAPSSPFMTFSFESPLSSPSTAEFDNGTSSNPTSPSDTRSSHLFSFSPKHRRHQSATLSSPRRAEFEVPELVKSVRKQIEKMKSSPKLVKKEHPYPVMVIVEVEREIIKAEVVAASPCISTPEES
ncbi:hypothetical protein L218DRAFT_997378 [Marasmius fiardii PR-910]|nr:hypothetical protein L218DRAFT_997378 [Marasmius fiardii PR-910]